MPAPVCQLLYCTTGFSNVLFFVFFFNDTATTEIYTLSLHDALPISEPVPSTSGVGEIAACPPSPIVDDPSALPSPNSSPSSSQ